ncbi:ABC transporter permease [Pseudochryseolinea flava]|uniref:ABC transporter permease n=1 Tax=Pseudochryseolinea flava TaxID=2059302 RepID=A0A364Y223_9BACT|nr:ABC transporter permease [Pseudochryseolinea flava]RAV99825.1 ABC transporter permease [Pseudochryseolinea flava]
MRNNPPPFFHRFFQWYCKPKLRDFIEGDLIEEYNERIRTFGKRKADFRFALDVIKLFRPGIIGRDKNFNRINNLAMLQNNFKIAFRNLQKNKVSSVINIFGLTTGIASCLLIMLFIQYELSFDKFQEKGNRIARVIMEYSFDGAPDSQKGNFTSTKVAPVFSRTFPEVERAVRISDLYTIVKHGEELITEKEFLHVDSSFFDLFHYELVKGSVGKAFHGINKLVLTESTAKRYFDSEDPIGKSLLIGTTSTPYEVVAVVKDYPTNSQIKFDFLGSFSSMGANQESTYYNANYTTYLLLRDEYALPTLQEKLHPFMEKESKGTGSHMRFFLERFSDIHIYSPYDAFVPNTSLGYMYIVGGVALLIIIIVCFTYVNLCTARSVERAKEVGIRKVSGAAKAQLFWQFIGESFVLCVLSLITSLAVVGAVLPFFNQLVGKQLTFDGLLNPAFLLGAFGVTITISFLAGAYPALILSGLQPAKVLKGVFRNTNSAKWVQQSLIVFQFAISILLIVATLVIQNQLYFIQHEKLGYDREHVVQLRINWDMPHDKAEVLKQELNAIPGVVSVSRCGNSPVRIISGYTMAKGWAENDEFMSVNANPTDTDFLKTTELELVTGSNFTIQDMKDAGVEDWEKKQYHFIINESACRKLGWTPEEAIGQKMFVNRPGYVRGVMKDFNFKSMHESIAPLVFFTETTGSVVLVKTTGTNIQETLDAAKEKWKTLVPERPFEFQFLDDSYNRLYESEQQLSQVMNVFAAIAIILATLGLFGLSSYMIQQRTKEIGIRKALGANLSSLLVALSGNFLRLVVIAILIACPIGYLAMKQWLNGFAYRIDLQWWIFLVSGLSALLIAAVTVSIHSIRASRANPVNSLRSE